MLVGGARLAAAQTAAASLDKQEVTMTDLLKLDGKVLGEGANTRATGKYKVATYRVEELTLPQAVEVEVRGQKTRATQAFRVTLTGGPFAVRAMPPVIWIDDTAVGYGVESEDLDAITAVTFDAELLRDGATLYLSYGDKEDKTGRVALPEKLKLVSPKGGVR
ncbi:MAG: hypothetical protein JOZ52_12250 [Acidobacteria bacterium]|nr:hypothetical protein [Acidobacteriota bacterium]